MKFVIYLIVIIAFILTAFFVIVDYAPTKMVPILSYNHVALGEEENVLYVSPRNFEWQIKFLWKNRINVITLGELISYYKKNEMPPKRSVVITFNSGFEDFATYAYPLLRKYKMPATVFLMADKIDKTGYLKSKQIREYASKGLITFGSQGVSDKVLPKIPQQDAYNEIFYSKQKISEILGEPVKFFSYNDGKFNRRIKQIVKECRYLGACTTSPGRKYSDRNIYAMKRTLISNKDTNVWSFKIKVWGNFLIVREWIKEKFGK